MIMEGTMESLKEIHSESKLYKSNYGANEIEFSIFNPKVALSLIETYVDCESSRDILDEIFRSPSLISSATDLWKGLSSSVYWNKSLVNGEARRRILGSFKQ